MDLGGDQIDEINKEVLTDLVEETFKGKRSIIDRLKAVIEAFTPVSEFNINETR